MENMVILTGTDPSSRKGGIGFAMAGYIEALERRDIPYRSIPTYHPDDFRGRWLLFVLALPRILADIRSARRKSKGVVVYSHAGAGVSLVREGVVLAFSKLFGASTVVQIHAPQTEKYLTNRLKKVLFKIALSGADRIAVLTPWWQNRFIQAGITQPVYVISNPLPPSLLKQAIKKRKKNRLPGTTKNGNILSLSRLEPGKGFDLVISALAELPTEIELTIAGDGKMLDFLKHQAESRGVLERTSFVGWVEGDKKQSLFEEADLFCLPSTNDSFGMGFIEAMANGLPVVALRYGALPDVIPDGRAGILVDEPTPRALANAIMDIMANDESRARMGLEGKKWVQEQFDPNKIGAKIQNLFSGLL